MGGLNKKYYFESIFMRNTIWFGRCSVSGKCDSTMPMYMVLRVPSGRKDFACFRKPVALETLDKIVLMFYSIPRSCTGCSKKSVTDLIRAGAKKLTPINPK